MSGRIECLLLLDMRRLGEEVRGAASIADCSSGSPLTVIAMTQFSSDDSEASSLEQV